MPVLSLRVGHRTATRRRSTHRLLQLRGISQSGLDAALEVGGWRQMFTRARWRSTCHHRSRLRLGEDLAETGQGRVLPLGPSLCFGAKSLCAARPPRGDCRPVVGDGCAALKVGNTIHAHTDCGPLIRPREVDRVAQWVSEARQRGATDSFGRHRCHIGLLVVPKRDLVNLAKIDFFPDPVFILAVADPVNLHVVDAFGFVLVEREVT